MGVLNPYSKISSFLLYLYTMELGDPPIYAELTRVSRDLDFEYRDVLGPLSKALFDITWQGESFKQPADTIKTGQ